MKNKRFFSKTLLFWDQFDNKREMPWKGEKDPYKIWISEIILQQTRVQQGLAYYYKFIHTFPDVKSLANAREEKVFKLWEGLGYYSRCRNLISAAKYVHINLGNKFPEKYEEIIALKGIGSYTASAIASFAYNQPYAVLDGNVFRVLSRFFGIEIPVDTTEGKKMYSQLAGELLDKKNAGKYNQAIMDFGAIICKPAQPLCAICPLRLKCIAFQKGLVNVLPVKSKTIKKRERFFSYLIVEYSNKFYIKRRNYKDIWQGLYEFILLETAHLPDVDQLDKMEEYLSLFQSVDITVINISKIYRQKLTHQTIAGRFFHIRISQELPVKEEYILATKKQIDSLPFPKFITTYLGD